MVARRAHNPEVRRFKSPLRNQNKDTHRVSFCFGCGGLTSRLSGYADERSSLGLARCRCRWQMKARREYRSGRKSEDEMREHPKAFSGTARWGVFAQHERESEASPKPNPLDCFSFCFGAGLPHGFRVMPTSVARWDSRVAAAGGR